MNAIVDHGGSVYASSRTRGMFAVDRRSAAVSRFGPPAVTVDGAERRFGPGGFEVDALAVDGPTLYLATLTLLPLDNVVLAFDLDVGTQTSYAAQHVQANALAVGPSGVYVAAPSYLTWGTGIAFLPRSPADAAPRSVAPPTIGGLFGTGVALHAGLGGWLAKPGAAASVTWLRCDSFGDDCVPIGGAAGTSYVPRPADVGARLRVRVREANAAGSASADSAASPVVRAFRAPRVPFPPEVTGRPRAGRLLRCVSVVTATPAPRVSFVWLRNWRAIPGATQTTYRVRRRDRGARIACLVRATNVLGTAGFRTRSVRIR